jgi:hypothetical protein
LVPSTETRERSQFLQEPSVINASTPSRP